jgi:peptidoglycan/LPS O-acetylase OafA/YrhL
MIIGVTLFFVLCAFGMAWLHHRVPDHGGNLQPSEQHQP